MNFRNSIQNTFVPLLVLFVLVFNSQCASTKLDATSNSTPSFRTNFTENEILEFKYYYFKGMELEKAKDYTNAIKCFYKCLAIDSLDYPSLRNVSLILQTIGSHLGAKDYAQRALEVAELKGISTVEMSKLLINFYKKNNLDNEVLKLYTGLVKKYPENRHLKEELSSYYAEIFQFGKSDKLVSELEEKYGVYNFVLKQTFQNSLANKKFEKAKLQVAKLLETYSDSIQFELLYAEVALAAADTTEAIKLYEDYTLKYSSPLSKIKLANLYESMGQRTQAYQMYHELVTDNTLNASFKIQTLNQSGFRLRIDGPVDSLGYVLTDKLLELHPKQFDYRYLYKESLFRNSKFDPYVVQLKKLVSLDTTNAQIAKELINVLNQQGKFEEMYDLGARAYDANPYDPILIMIAGRKAKIEEQYKRAAEIFEQGKTYCLSNKNILFSIYMDLSDCYFQLKDEDKTIQYAEEALKIKKANALLLNNYSYYLSLFNKDLDRAKDLSRKAVSLEPNNAIYLDTFAWVCFKRKEYKDALNVIRKAVELHQKSVKSIKDVNAELIEHFGDILYMNGKKELARKKWEEAKKYTGYSEKLDEKIKKGTYID